MANDYTGRIAPLLPGCIGRAANLLALAAVDQGDGTGALLVSLQTGGQTNIVPSGTSSPVVLRATPGTLGNIINSQNAANVPFWVFNAATVAACAASNAIYANQTPGAGQILTFDTFCNAGIVLSFASAITGNYVATFD